MHWCGGPDWIICGSAEPKMAEIRYCGGSQRRLQPGSRILGTFHFREEKNSGGRWLAFGSRSGAAQVVPRGVLGDGSEERAKEISKKTYEVFFQGHSRLRRE